MDMKKTRYTVGDGTSLSNQSERQSSEDEEIFPHQLPRKMFHNVIKLMCLRRFAN